MPATPIRLLEDVLSEKSGKIIDPHRQIVQPARERAQMAEEDRREREKREGVR